MTLAPHKMGRSILRPGKTNTLVKQQDWEVESSPTEIQTIHPEPPRTPARQCCHQYNRPIDHRDRPDGRRGRLPTPLGPTEQPMWTTTHPQPLAYRPKPTSKGSGKAIDPEDRHSNPGTRTPPTTHLSTPLGPTGKGSRKAIDLKDRLPSRVFSRMREHLPRPTYRLHRSRLEGRDGKQLSTSLEPTADSLGSQGCRRGAAPPRGVTTRLEILKQWAK